MPEYEIRAAREGEFEAVRALWKEGFGDSDDYIDAYRKLVYRPENTEVALAEGRIVSMVMVIPAELHLAGQAPLPAGYAYVLTTAQDHRGNGIGTRTIRSMAERKTAEGMACIANSPDSDGLRALYARHGWQTAFYVRECNVAADALSAPVQAVPASAEEYHYLREAALRGTDHYSFGLSAVRLEEFVCHDGGGGLFRFPSRENCCAAAAYDERGRLQISELLAPDRDILACAAGVLSCLPAASAGIRLPVWSDAGLCAKAEPFAMLLPLGGIFQRLRDKPSTYLGFDFC